MFSISSFPQCKVTLWDSVVVWLEQVSGEGGKHVSWGSTPQPGHEGKQDKVTSPERMTSSHHIAQSFFPGGSPAANEQQGSLPELSSTHIRKCWANHTHLSRSLVLLGWWVEPQSSFVDNQIGPTWHRKEQELIWAWKITPSCLLPCQGKSLRNFLLTTLCKDSSGVECLMQLVNLQGTFYSS